MRVSADKRKRRSDAALALHPRPEGRGFTRKTDKTATIFDLLTTGKYYFLSRPRRFGKSLTLSVIKYLYGGRRDLFTGLSIEPQWDWNKTHPVLHISFSDIGYKTLGLEAAMLSELQLLSAKWGIELREAGIARQFRELLRGGQLVHSSSIAQTVAVASP